MSTKTTWKREAVDFFQPQGEHEAFVFYGDPAYWRLGGPATEEEIDHALLTILRNAQQGMK